jgi:hypothetical protein
MTLDEAGDLLDKYADTEPTPTPTTKKAKKAKEAAKKKKLSHNKAASRQLGILEEEGY